MWVSLISSGSCGIQISLLYLILYTVKLHIVNYACQGHAMGSQCYTREINTAGTCVGLSYDNLVITCQVCKLHHYLYFIPALGKPAVNRDLDVQWFLICSTAPHSRLFPCCSLHLPFVWEPSWYRITIVSDSNWLISYTYHSKISSCICPKGVLNWYHGSTIKNDKTRSINSVLSRLLYRGALSSCGNIMGIL